jgi:photosystem II stability/assembly factor-like uncharacterized protein
MIVAATAVVCVLAGTSAWAGVGVWSGQGPYGGYVFDILQDPSTPTTLYISTRSGIFKSTDGGATWAPMMNGIVGSVSYGYPLVVDADAANTLYAADSTGHLYRTTDGAADWMQTGYVLAPLANGTVQINKIVDAPGSTTRLYLATYASGILVSNDGGATFSPLNGSGANILPAGVPFQWLSVDPANSNNLLAGTASFDAGPGADVPEVFRSSDGGANWTGVLVEPQGGESLYGTATDIVFGHGAEVYAIVDGAIYRSPDSGASWNIVSTATLNVQGYLTTLKADTSVANGLYAGGYFGLAHSTDGGVTFTSVATQANGFTPNGVDVATAARLAINGSTWWLASQEAGLYISTDSGAHWTGGNSGIDATNIRALGMVPTGSAPRILAGYGDAFRPSPGIYAGTDAGDGNVSWANSNSGLRAYQIRAIMVDPTTATGTPGSTVVYAGGRSEQVVAIAPRNGGIYKSTDGGNSWTTIDSGLPLHQPTSSPAPFVGTVRSIVLDPHSCAGYPGSCSSALNTVYATSNGCYVYTSIASGSPSPSLVGYCGSPLNTTYNGSYQFRIFKSTNGGANWSTSDSGIPPSFIGTPPDYADFESLLVVPLIIDPSNPSILYAGTSDSFDATQVTTPTLVTGIYKSTDVGATWNPINTGLPTYPAPSTTVLGVLTLAIDPLDSNTLWASVIDINSTTGAPGHIYKTTDGGAHWADSSSGMTSADIRALLVDHPSVANPAVVYAAGGGTAGNPGGVFISYDAGSTWHSKSIGLPADAALALALDPNDSTKLYAGTSSGVWEITQTLDTDHDGVSDIQEDLGPNNGDSNLDGIKDKIQPDVTYVPPHASARPASRGVSVPEFSSSNDFAIQVAAQNAGTTCLQTQDVQSKSASANGPDPVNAKLDFSYPLDLVQFEILNCAATTVLVTYPNFSFGEGWSFRFYGPATPGDDASIKWYDFSTYATQLDSHTWQLSLTRGAFGSYRPDSTGAILFQGGPAYDDDLFGNGFD